MASLHLSFLFTFSFLIVLAPIKPAFSVSSVELNHSDPSASVHDVLTSHGLPIGLFPKGISHFWFDPSSGRFELHLTQSSCDAKFETNVRYDWNVSGTITYGQVAGISGVAAQDLFLWFPVKDIHVDIPSSGLIYFDVGVVSKQFSLSFFETPHDCVLPVDVQYDQKFSSTVDLSFLANQKKSENHLEGYPEGHARKAVS
ncbi:hypothetical protein M9H77_34995 [Catharanthus roseus]|uniref:Uncharacterized protein n=1 Tax=Catharanthus roseus TaxID=4058 RepID=A0ACB9ZNI2_CATRO|nr:hypothetical protein M9H77_34995 [Catharanthus roseus]